MPNDLKDDRAAENDTIPLSQNVRLPASWIAWLVLGVSLSVTAVGWSVANKHAQEAARAQFDARSIDVIQQIQQRMHTYEYVLRGGAALFASSDSVGRAEWRHYVAGLKLDQHLTGILGVGFARHIPAQKKGAHIAQVRAEGFPDYAISPIGQRSEYTSIVYLEPFSGRNLRAFGYDMYSEPVRRTAMARARDTGETAISGKVALVQETDKDIQAGFLMYLPVYKNGAPHSSLAERRAALLGYVYSPFRMNDLMDGIVGRRIPDLDVHIYDGKEASPAALMFESFREDRMSHGKAPSFASRVSISVGGHEWTVHATSLPSFDAETAKKSPSIILVMGSFISLLLFFIVRGHERSRRQATKALRESEFQLHTLLDQTPAILWALDTRLHFTLSQGAGLAALKLSPGQVVGMPLHEYLGTDDAAHPIMEAARQALLGRDGEFDFESNGVWFQNSIKPLKNEQGEIAGVLGISFEITARKRAQLELEWVGRLYRLLSRVNEAIVRSHDRNELFGMICRAAVESGLFRMAWVGMLDGQEPLVVPVAHSGFEDGYLEKLHIRLDDERTRNGPTATAIRNAAHVVCQDIQNDPKMLQWREAAVQRGYHSSGAFPICEAGKAVGTINVYAVDGYFFSSDIVELMLELSADVSFALDVFSEKKLRESAEEELRQLNLELERRVQERTHQLEVANGELEAFSYSVSHDLRAPLRSIDGFSQIVLEKYQAQLDATGADYLQRVRRASQRMGLLIDDLLQLSRVARGVLKHEVVDLGVIAENVAGELRKAAPERHADWMFQQGLSVYADPGLMRIVLDNLLGNAWKFTGKKADAKIEFGQCDCDGESAFYIRDNGDGFNMAYAHKLFGAFQRLHGATEFEGTGIGLATVRRIIHRHHGKVWAEGIEGKGAMFFFTLPQRLPETEGKE
ncbi:MAG TPA: CHASE domain-containing protein [Gallionella sp.]|nr:CHASE domain-containing protein [Gallionella sp.]